MNTEEPNPAPRRQDTQSPPSGGSGANRTGLRLWLKLLLAGSLAVNLAVAGLAIGAAVRWHDGDHPGRRPPSVGSMIFRDLDRDTRSDLRRRAEGDHGSYVARRRAEGEAVISALLTDPFDARMLAQVLEQQAETRHAFQVSVQEAWIAQVETMPPDERRVYAQRLQELMRKHTDWRKPKPPLH